MVAKIDLRQTSNYIAKRPNLLTERELLRSKAMKIYI